MHSILKYLYLSLGCSHNGPLKEYTSQTVAGCDSNGSVLWGSAVSPRREQGQHVSVVALTIKFKKKTGGKQYWTGTNPRDL